MENVNPSDVTSLLESWRCGDPEAGERLMPLVYAELRKIAGGYLASERRDHTLQPTALVHEAYLRLIDQRRSSWANRSHFFGIAAKTIRRILVDHARHHKREKRGGGVAKISIVELGDVPADRPEELIRLDAALVRLQEVAPEQAQIVEYRYFGGLTGDEIAEILGCSRATVTRQWRLAKAWLYREMTRE